ncbi:MAG TPA: protein kinase, partial [Terriglobia bacterium]|nr:protein kinase [Terriglobia bacterium]
MREEIESLLAEDPGLASFLEEPVLGDAVKLLEYCARDSWVGRTLGTYQVVSLIGEGGMGQVYCAQDTHLRREVALKILSPAVMLDPNRNRRFLDEARLASSLNHPNIVTIYSVGEAENVTFIAMELVRGRTLRDMVETGAIPLHRTLDLAFQICDALAAAHARGIVHRDLKPENVMITDDDRVKVLDFGIAKRHDDLLSDVRTADGAILGTPGYMSPEQAAGRVAGHTSDQFSFGAILYEMLAGRRAFAAETPMETLSLILRDDPPLIGTLNPEVPEALRQILDRCLAKDPSNRYLDTRDLASEIRALRDRTGMSAFPASPLLTRRRVLALGGAGAAASLAALVGWKFWPRDAGIRSLAVLPFKNSTTEEDAAFLSVLIADNLIRDLAAVGSLRVLPRSASMSFKGDKADALSAGRLLNVDGVVSGTVERRGGRLLITAELTTVQTGLLWRGTYDEMETDLILVSDRIAEKIASLAARLDSRGNAAPFHRYVSENWEAAELYARALEHQDKEQEEDYTSANALLETAIEKDPRFPLAYVALARNHTIMAVDGYRRPNEMWPQVYRYSRKALDLDPTLLEANSGLAAEAFYFRWDWQTAEQEYKRAWSAPVNGQSMGWVLLRWALGRHGDALDLVRQARRFDPVSLMWRLREAGLLTQMGRSEEAGTLYDQIIHDEKTDARAYFGLAELRRAQGRFDEAIVLIRTGIRLDAGGEPLPEALEHELTTAKASAGFSRVEQVLAKLELESMTSRVADNYVSPLDFARAHSRLGNKDEA